MFKIKSTNNSIYCNMNVSGPNQPTATCGFTDNNLISIRLSRPEGVMSLFRVSCTGPDCPERPVDVTPVGSQTTYTFTQLQAYTSYTFKVITVQTYQASGGVMKEKLSSEYSVICTTDQKGENTTNCPCN